MILRRVIAHLTKQNRASLMTYNKMPFHIVISVIRRLRGHILLAMQGQGHFIHRPAFIVTIKSNFSFYLASFSFIINVTEDKTHFKSKKNNNKEPHIKLQKYMIC